MYGLSRTRTAEKRKAWWTVGIGVEKRRRVGNYAVDALQLSETARHDSDGTLTWKVLQTQSSDRTYLKGSKQGKCIHTVQCCTAGRGRSAFPLRLQHLVGSREDGPGCCGRLRDKSPICACFPYRIHSQHSMSTVSFQCTSVCYTDSAPGTPTSRPLALALPYQGR